MKILLYNEAWGEKCNLPDMELRPGFTLTDNRDDFSRTDVVVFHMPNMAKQDILNLAKQKPANQIWVFWTMESRVHYEWQYSSQISTLFDVTMTYKITSDVPVPYIYSEFFEMMRLKPVEKKQKINSFISSEINKSGRLEFQEELMSYIDVHSFGRKLNNMVLNGDEGYITKEKILSGYKFTLGLENAIEHDYVTEKFFIPLALGSVPIYLGAPNVNEFAPGDNCYIDVTTFSTVKELAQYIDECCHNDALYNSFFEWKNKPFNANFFKILNSVQAPPFLRLCDLISYRFINKTIIQ